jgi:hypothetical protein
MGGVTRLSQVNTEIQNLYYKSAKMRVHYSRLPKELQKKIKQGAVKSFEQVCCHACFCATVLF